ncbi:MAG TPA: AAA family ATPase [Thermoanaerobaculia bacterium]|nr:AAA family ATPase [Thermoanaerobaculia bacterium]
MSEPQASIQPPSPLAGEGRPDFGRLTPELAHLLGDGGDIVAEASRTACAQIEPVHFLAHFAQMGGAIIRVELLEPRGVTPGRFCDNLYEAVLDDDRARGVPIEFGRREFSAAARQMWDAFEQEIASRRLERGTEALFMLVLLDHLPPAASRLLAAVVGSEGSLERFHASLRRRLAGGGRTPVFDPETSGVLESAFDRSGRRVLARLREEAAALGCRKATALHLLYALAGVENGFLQRGLQFQAIDPVREVHAPLSRELSRAGMKRVRDLALDRSSLHGSVAGILEAAAAEAERHGLPIGELHIARALFAARGGVVPEFLLSHKINVELLREYLARAEDESEETSEGLRLPVREIEAELGRRIIGQDHAIRRILPWIKRLRFGFPRDRGAAAVLLFLGPSGTGKTQLAKELARIVYGSEDDLLMLEMGQFNSKESINLFIGAPPGYLGYGEGKLTNGLRDKPQSVVLFDEIEKAHADVWVALLRFLDEGLISDPAGPTRDGRRCIVVLTSNLGADSFARLLPPPAAADSAELDRQLEEEIRREVVKYLHRPEIYNRVDDKLVFRPFSREVYRTLVERQVAAEVHRFREVCGTRVEVQDDVLGWLAEQAAGARAEGARCVPRLANRFVVGPVIDLLTRDDDHPVAKVVVSRLAEATVAEAAERVPE